MGNTNHGQSNADKQAAHGWGESGADGELADEQAAEAIAKSDEKEAIAGDGNDAPVNAEGEAPEEPEDNSISYADYLIQQAEKKAALAGEAREARKANEGTKENKKWASAKALEKDEEADYFAGSGGKAKREKERKVKQVIDIDQRFVEAPERGGRGEGRGRGGRGRGDGPRRGGDRGGRGDGPRGGRGDRGGRGRGDGPARGPRGGPRGASGAINTSDSSAFPALGA